MICPSCGNQLEDGLKFCPHCGEKIDPIEAMIKESEPTRSVETPKDDEPVPAPAQPAEKDSSGNKKRIAIAVGIIAAVIIALFAGRAVLNKMHEKTYKEANKAYATQKYEEALKGYNKLGDYEDAKSRAKTCQQWIDYKAAIKLMDKGSYEEALKAFKSLRGFQDSDTQITHCENMIEYEKAETLFEEEKWAEARDIYNKLPISEDEGLKDAAEHLKYCNNIIAYNEGAQLLKDKKLYEAYTKLSPLGDFKDAKALADSCVQAFPATGETYRNEKYPSKAVQLKIVPPSNGGANYLKFYTGSDLVSCVAIANGSTATVSLPVGTYTIKDAYSTGPWFGETEMFGDKGTYIKLTNGSSDTFTLQANMIYTLTLRSSTATTGDSVGSKSENRSSF